MLCVKNDDEWFPEGQVDKTVVCGKKSIVTMLRSGANKRQNTSNFITLIKEEDVSMALTGE